MCEQSVYFLCVSSRYFIHGMVGVCTSFSTLHTHTNHFCASHLFVRNHLFNLVENAKVCTKLWRCHGMENVGWTAAKASAMAWLPHCMPFFRCISLSLLHVYVYICKPVTQNRFIQNKFAQNWAVEKRQRIYANASNWMSERERASNAVLPDTEMLFMFNNVRKSTHYFVSFTLCSWMAQLSLGQWTNGHQIHTREKNWEETNSHKIKWTSAPTIKIFVVQKRKQRNEKKEEE